MSLQPGRGPVVIDTDVYGAELVPGSRLAELYQAIIVGRAAFISFQTAAELRYGGLLRNWGEAGMRKLEARIAAAETVHTGPELVLTYARLRVECQRIGHPPARVQRRHFRKCPRSHGGDRGEVDIHASQWFRSEGLPPYRTIQRACPCVVRRRSVCLIH